MKQLYALRVMNAVAAFAATFMLAQKEAQTATAMKNKSVIRISSNVETFMAYHAFTVKVAGKRVLILECKE